MAGTLLRAPITSPFPCSLRRGPLPTPHRIGRHPCTVLCLDPMPDVTSLLECILSRKFLLKCKHVTEPGRSRVPHGDKDNFPDDPGQQEGGTG